MSCWRYKQLISNQLDGKISLKAAKKLENHLSRCPACRRYKENLEIIQSLASSWQGIESPPHYYDQLILKIRQRLAREQAGGEGRKKKRLLFPLPRWLWVLPLLTMLIAGVFYLFSLRENNQEIYLFSPEELWPVLVSQIGNDPAIFQAFNEMLEGQIQDFSWGEEEINHFPELNSLVLEELTEEEITLFLEELKKIGLPEGI